MLLTCSAAFSLAAAEVLPSVPTRDQKVVRRWALQGEPRGVAIGADGTIYVGLAQPQSVVAIESKSGTVRQRLVLDSAEIASPKELVTLRTNPARTRLYIANGSDESATILALPEMKILREITIEGETIRDALPDPKGRYVYVLGRRVHVYDGERWIDTVPGDFVHVPAGGIHAFRNESGEPASMLLHFSPGAPREGYFEGLAAGLGGLSDEERAEFYLRHDNHWL